MTEVFSTKDYQGRQVVLHTNMWEDHIVKFHPEIEEFVEQIQITIEKPQLVVESNLRSDTEIMLKRGNYRGLGEKYLSIYVRYEQSTEGIVTTSFFRSDLPKYKKILYFHKT